MQGEQQLRRESLLEFHQVVRSGQLPKLQGEKSSLVKILL